MPTDPESSVTRISYAQNGEDVRLWRAFSGMLESNAPGFYVEVGGWEPVDDSITNSFYLHGWSGVVVEPLREYSAAFTLARPRDRVVECLAGETIGESVLAVVPGTGLSTATPEHVAKYLAEGLATRTELVTVRTLDDILEGFLNEEQDIHFMTIDVEGSEGSVLRGLSLDRFRPWVLVVEATVPRSDVLAVSWEERILDNGYLLATFDGLNRFYVASEHSKLREALETPPNVLDNFRTIHYERALQELAKSAEERDAANRGLAIAAEERDAANREAVALQARLELCRAQLQAARDNTARAVEEREAETGRAGDMEARAADLEARLLGLENQLSGLLGSRSWRITRPLRKSLGNG